MYNISASVRGQPEWASSGRIAPGANARQMTMQYPGLVEEVIRPPGAWQHFDKIWRIAAGRRVHPVMASRIV